MLKPYSVLVREYSVSETGEKRHRILANSNSAVLAKAVETGKDRWDPKVVPRWNLYMGKGEVDIGDQVSFFRVSGRYLGGTISAARPLLFFSVASAGVNPHADRDIGGKNDSQLTILGDSWQAPC